eukprot:scaffold92278_cov62-Phaeocystis_antarctica.AAC.5
MLAYLLPFITCRAARLHAQDADAARAARGGGASSWKATFHYLLTTTDSSLTYHRTAEQEQLESYFSHLELEFQFDEDGEGYFKSPSCRELDEHFGDLEMRIKDLEATLPTTYYLISTALTRTYLHTYLIPTPTAYCLLLTTHYHLLPATHSTAYYLLLHLPGAPRAAARAAAPRLAALAARRAGTWAACSGKWVARSRHNVASRQALEQVW